MRNIFSSSPTITNCTFSANSGGGLANYNSSIPTVTNCIFWGNSSEIVGNSAPIVTYSIVQGGYAGTGNLNANPYFVNQPNFNNAPTTAGNLRLTTCSFAMDAGLDAANSTTEDLDGNARQFDAVAGGQQIDMGAYELQSQPPTISITCPGNFIGGQCGATSVTYPTPTASGNCDAPSLLSGIASGGTFPVGETTVVWKATNNSGQNNTCSFKVTVSGNDTQAPSISCPVNQTRSTNPGQCQANVTYPIPTATDNCALAAGSPSLQSGIASGGVFPKGINTVVWRATDQAGLTKTCTFRVTVNDNEPPAITCPGSQSVNVAAGACASAAVTYTTPSATDNCASPAPVVTRVSGPVSGSNFPKGVSNVTWRAVDAAGNAKTCSFSVTVTDNMLPGIACPGNVAVTAAPGQCNAVVTYANPTATDNCAVASVLLLDGLASGSVFPQGVTTNTWRAMDDSGLTATCTFTVTVSCGTGSEGSEKGKVKSEKLAVKSEKLAARTTDDGPQMAMNLSPNPAVTAVQIWVEHLGEKGGDLTVLDAQGRTLWQQSVAAQQPTVTLDVSGGEFAAGVYFVTLRSEGRTVAKRLVVCEAD